MLKYTHLFKCKLNSFIFPMIQGMHQIYDGLKSNIKLFIKKAGMVVSGEAHSMKIELLLLPKQGNIKTRIGQDNRPA